MIQCRIKYDKLTKYRIKQELNNEWINDMNELMNNWINDMNELMNSWIE